MVHGAASATGRRTSCQNCIRQKLKCSRLPPCDSCNSKGVECVFLNLSSNSISNWSTSTINPAESIPVASALSPSGSSISEHRPESLIQASISLYELSQSDNTLQVQQPQIVLDNIQQQYQQSPRLNGSLDLLEPSMVPPALDDMPQFQPEMIDLQDDRTLISSGNNLGNASSMDFANFGWDLSAPWGIDWLGVHHELPLSPEALSHPVPFCQSVDPLHTALADALQLTSAGPSTSAWSSTNLPHTSGHSLAATNPNIPASHERRSSQSSSIANTTLMESINSILSKPCLALDRTSSEHSAAILHLEKMISIFFAENYPGLPVMHRATWDIAKCPTHLISALACLGSTKYHRKKGLDEESSLLAKICFRHLTAAVGHFVLVSHMDSC